MANTWQIPDAGKPGDPMPDWLLAASRRGDVLKAADGSAMVPGATTSTCIARHGDSIVRRRDGSIDIEPATPSSIN